MSSGAPYLKTKIVGGKLVTTPVGEPIHRLHGRSGYYKPASRQSWPNYDRYECKMF